MVTFAPVKSASELFSRFIRKQCLIYLEGPELWQAPCPVHSTHPLQRQSTLVSAKQEMLVAEVIVRTFPLKLCLPIVIRMKIGEGAEKDRNHHLIKRASPLAHVRCQEIP